MSLSVLSMKEEARSFVSRVEETYLLQPQTRVERRSNERVNVTMPVVALPADHQMRLLNYKIHGMTKDISDTGVGFYTTDPIHCRYLILQFSPYKIDETRFVSRLVHCSSQGMYYHVGCEFITALAK